MNGLQLPEKHGATFTVLCLGAHSDDIEIGCGGTLLLLKEAYPALRFHWVVFSACGIRGEEAARSAEVFTAGCERQIRLETFRDGFLPYSGTDVKEYFERLKMEVTPNVIFTHWRYDAHQDHRLIAELTWNTFRDHLILEYEIPKYDGDIGQANAFVPLSAETADRKCSYLLRAFPSQAGKQWFCREVFLSMMRIRGMESNAPSGYAEAFHAKKMVIQPGR